MPGDKIILLVDRNLLDLEILQKAAIKAGIKDELVLVNSLEDSLAYIKSNALPSILFIEMTHLLLSSKEKFQEIIELRKPYKPLIVCLLLNDHEIEVIEKLDLQIDYYLVMPESLDIDENFITALKGMADRVGKGGTL
ncbi:MAG: hypothetical protein ACM3Q2_17960 [Syntrophothermus sp.]